MSARLTGGCGCSGIGSSVALVLVIATVADAGPPSPPPEVPADAGPRSTKGWFTDGSVLRLLILCFLFFNMVAYKSYER